MSVSKSVTVAVVGVGWIGPRHADSVSRCQEADLVCFVDPASNAESVAIKFGVPLFSSIQHMLEAGVKPDSAIVCTPNNIHVEVAKELLNAGVHVLIEKPISTTVAGGQDLIEAAQRRGRQLLVGHHRRFNPYITSAKDALSRGKIGNPIAVSGVWATYKPSSYFEAPTEWRSRCNSGGPILINLIHEVDCLQYLLGPIVRVYAEQTMSQRSHEVEEGAAILLRFASGVVGTFILSDATPSPHFFESATGENPTIPQFGKDVYRIFGTEGTLSVGDMMVTTCLPDDAKSWTSRLCESRLVVAPVVPFDEQIKHFVRVVRREEEPRCSGEDGLNALKVCEAIKTALTTKLPVDIEAA